MNEREFVRDVVHAFGALGIPYFITGGMAAIAYGELRFTNDLDVAVELDEADVPELLTRFPSPEYYLSESAMREAIDRRSQFNILHPSSGNKADVMILSAGEYDQLRMRRKRQLDIDSQLHAYFASPEDVIIKKLEYFKLGGSEKHLRDIASMLLIRQNEINLKYIAEWANQLKLQAEWQVIVTRIDKPSA